MVNSTRSSASSILELMVITDRQKKFEDDPINSKFIPVPSKVQLKQSIAAGEIQDLDAFINIYWHVIKTETVFKALYEAIQHTHNEKRIKVVKLFYSLALHKRMSKFELMDKDVQEVIQLTLKYIKVAYTTKISHLEELSEFEKRYLKKISPLRKKEVHQAPFMFELTGDPITLGGKFESIREIIRTLLSYDTKILRDAVALRRWSKEAIPGLDFLPDNTPLDQMVLFAKQITAVQIQIFKRITPFEFNKKVEYPISYLKEARAYYNMISCLVENLILAQESCHARVNAIFVFKIVLEQLLADRDFQSALAVYNSFSKNYIFRLKETWRLFRKHFAVEFKQAAKYEDILNEKHSYENIKKIFAELDEAKAPYIPLLNTFEGQIASLSESIVKKNEEGKVNCGFIDIYNTVMQKIFDPITHYPIIPLETDFFYFVRYIHPNPQIEEKLMKRSYEIEKKTKREVEIEEEEEIEKQIFSKNKLNQG